MAQNRHAGLPVLDVVHRQIPLDAEPAVYILTIH